ncbi:hypothetical protein [Xylanibacillus composti]|uniref:Uncharacterized protein n=1 Tax=Xylanibacillus composti TaxID=1572762 RepID=A0A8J4H267_9BACL|nr:hypothetical protein [Xylanibacillus composti]GIQ68230.1 hypothetical protein XYCOK13_10540 [Xylanibacillus composti]
MAKRKPTYFERRQQQEQVNTKAIAWIASVFAVLVIALSVLIILD